MAAGAPGKEQPSEATPAYLFLFYGGAAYEDWDLSDLLLAAHGEDEGKRRLQEFENLVVGEQTVYAVEPVD